MIWQGSWCSFVANLPCLTEVLSSYFPTTLCVKSVSKFSCRGSNFRDNLCTSSPTGNHSRDVSWRQISQIWIFFYGYACSQFCLRRPTPVNNPLEMWCTIWSSLQPFSEVIASSWCNAHLLSPVLSCYFVFICYKMLMCQSRCSSQYIFLEWDVKRI